MKTCDRCKQKVKQVEPVTCIYPQQKVDKLLLCPTCTTETLLDAKVPVVHVDRPKA